MSKKKKKGSDSTLSSSQDSIESKQEASSSALLNANNDMTFGKENFKWLSIGVALLVVGMLLMLGGFNEDPNVWDESKIYGFQRTVLAPFVILSGLVVNVYALFK